MSANPHSLQPHREDLLGELLHSLSQPLTSLRCSLELSLDAPAERQQESISGALEQTERVIGAVRLIREYLDAEQVERGVPSCALAPALRGVTWELSSIACVRGVRLFLHGTCSATLAVEESRLRLALQYLISAIIETQPAGARLALVLSEGPWGTVLRAERLSDVGPRRRVPVNSPPVGSHRTAFHRARLAIARRVLEGAGASLTLDDDNPTRFVLRIPRRA